MLECVLELWRIYVIAVEESQQDHQVIVAICHLGISEKTIGLGMKLIREIVKLKKETALQEGLHYDDLQHLADHNVYIPIKGLSCRTRSAADSEE